MVPHKLLRYSVSGSEVVPCYFTESDHRWLRALLDEYERFEGEPRHELAERLADGLSVRAPRDKQRIAQHVLDRLWGFRTTAPVPPARVRAALFGAATRHAQRQMALAEAGAELGLTEEVMMATLFADLASEKRLARPAESLSPARLAERANLALVAGMLNRALGVRIRARGKVRPLLRQAKLRGLLCSVRERADGPGEELAISGPYALFRHTLLYGRALASLVPFAAWCDDMEMRARCVLDNGGPPRWLVIRSGDPLFPRPEPARFDSKLERRFAADIGRLLPDWDVIREPVAVRAGGTFIFADFELRHRRRPAERWLVEILGFWTPEYLASKLESLRCAGLDRLILCIDEARRCADGELPDGAQVVGFRRGRIDAAAVVRIVEQGLDSPACPAGGGARMVTTR